MFVQNVLQHIFGFDNFLKTIHFGTQNKIPTVNPGDREFRAEAEASFVSSYEKIFDGAMPLPLYHSPF